MERQIDRVERPVERGPSDQVQAKRTMLRPNAYAEQSPFLHLSEDWFAAPAGFETHPHRGMQTVTLVLGGALRHRDHTGADGVLRPGDVQWMTAGRGVLHSEMPHGRDTAHTLQLWVNLPAAAKMIPARYIDQPLATVPLRRMDGIELRVYAGRSGDIVQPHGSHWPLMFIDIAMEAGRSVAQEIPAQFRAFLYLLEGSVLLGRERRKVSAPAVAWVEPRPDGGDAIDLLAIEAEQPMRGVLFGGLPIHEPVVAYGPFVMNTVDEIRQAFADYQANRLTG